MTQLMDTYVVRLADIPQMRDWHVTASVVVDATLDAAPSRQQLAQIVVLRRRLRAAGGNLVVAANADTADALRATGLHWAVPCHSDLSIALTAVRR
jgi:hypothetical protein